MSVLLNTKLRRKLLTYSFTHCDEEYYVRELSSLIDEDPGNLSRELRRLETEGLYTSFTKGKLRFYSLNKRYPLFKELKEVIFKTEGVEGSLRELVLKYKGIALALIFGSYAKNREKATSDVDLLIVGELNENRFTRDVRDLESRLNREINFTIYTEEEFNEKKKKEGCFLNFVIKDKIIILKGKLSARRVTHKV
ncbi:MAG: nucleotidyltransferase domain-containing protein [Candidatus Eisenbacteria bacterium]|nr:nucleotidyltransferase domain-containing protein [Candidatus Eisenbacteria bacterium]